MARGLKGTDTLATDKEWEARKEKDPTRTKTRSAPIETRLTGQEKGELQTGGVQEGELDTMNICLMMDAWSAMDKGQRHTTY
jgi:hypothetical protein